MEIKAPYLEKDETTGDTFTVYIRQRPMIRELIDLGFGKNKSDIVRQAIDFFYQSKVNGHES